MAAAKMATRTSLLTVHVLPAFVATLRRSRDGWMFFHREACFRACLPEKYYPDAVVTKPAWPPFPGLNFFFLDNV
jgi:hypothetical protein